MNSMLRVLGSAALLGAFLMTGCGDDDGNPAVATTTTQIMATQATLNPNGTVTTTAPVSAATSSGVTAITIPANTTITAKDAAGNVVTYSGLPSITVSTLSGVQGLPKPKTPGVVITAVAGAVDIAIASNTVLFSQPVQITIPVSDPSKIGDGTVYMNKNDGNGYIPLTDKATYNAATKTATISVSNLCVFTIGTEKSGTTGTGGTGGTGF